MAGSYIGETSVELFGYDNQYSGIKLNKSGTKGIYGHIYGNGTKYSYISIDTYTADETTVTIRSDDNYKYDGIITLHTAAESGSSTYIKVEAMSSYTQIYPTYIYVYESNTYNAHIGPGDITLKSNYYGGYIKLYLPGGSTHYWQQTAASDGLTFKYT